MHKDIIDSYHLKKRHELQQSLPAEEDADMVNTLASLARVPHLGDSSSSAIL